MRVGNLLLVGVLASGQALASPFSFSMENHQMPMMDASTAGSFAFSEVSPVAPLFNWVHSSLSRWLPTSSISSDNVRTFSGDDQYSTFEKPDFPDKTIWEVIQENEYLTDLKKVLKYSGPGARKLLDDKEKKLTFLAPVNWHHDDHKEEELNWFKLGQWNNIEKTINMFENEQANTFEDDKDKERKRKWLAIIIDATLRYHVLESGKEPLTTWQITQNSSVATDLTIGKGKAREVLGNLLDGYPYRLRVGKSLLPRPSLYFNFYSRLVYPDVNVGGSLVHAVSLPLLIPPSALQTLYFSVPELAGTVAALQKTHTDGYFRLPINHSAIDHEYSPLGQSAHCSPIDAAERLEHMFEQVSVDEIEAMDAQRHTHHRDEDGSPHHGGRKGHSAPGQPDLTLFAPDNIAWYRLPPLLRIFLWSPYGSKVLGKVLALHSLPKTIFYADFVHTRDDKLQLQSKETISAHDLVNSPEWLWGPQSEQPSVPFGDAEVTRYTFNTALPKIHHKDPKEGGISLDKEEFETVDVAVYRYKILPGGRGPLQTRISVQGVPIVFQDIAVANGALHVISRFIKPKGHPHKGIWAYASEEASKFGFGDGDLAAQML